MKWRTDFKFRRRAHATSLGGFERAAHSACIAGDYNLAGRIEIGRDRDFTAGRDLGAKLIHRRELKADQRGHRAPPRRTSLLHQTATLTHRAQSVAERQRTGPD